MGVAIIAFSIFLVLALRPLTKKSLEYMKLMKQYAPEIEKLKKRHKGDNQKFAQAQSEFYKQKGINPTAGCLPQLIQIAILFALFSVFSTVLHENNVTGFNNLLYSPLKIAEGQTINTKFLYFDITKPDTLKLPFLPFAIPGALIFLAAAAQMISAKIASPYLAKQEKIAKKTPSETDDVLAATQSSMVYMFPLMTLLFGLSFPSGMALYWLVFSIYNAIQQYQIAGWGGATPWVRRLASFTNRK